MSRIGEQRKEHKLLLQVSVITIVIFASVLAFVLISDFNRTKESYLASKNELIDRELDSLSKNLEVHRLLPWALSFTEEHGDEVTTPEAEARLHELFMDYAFSDVFNACFVDESKEPEEVPEEYRAPLATHIYEFFKEEFIYYREERNFADAYFLDIRDGHTAFLFADGTEDSEKRRDGTLIDYEASDHSAVKTILGKKKGAKAEKLYETFFDPVEKRYYYIGYRAFPAGDGSRAYLCLKYDWTAFHGDLNRRVALSAVISLLVLLVHIALLMLFLYRNAISPIRKMEEGMLGYMRDKDSKAVTEKMDRIRVKNEVGVLASNFSRLAVEIDRYTDEIGKLTGEREKVAAELMLASRIQSESLPGFPAFPDRKEFGIFAVMEPAKEVGGDFYDFFLIGEDRLALVVADVSDKGVPAALFMMTAMTMIRTQVRNEPDPAKTLFTVNSLLSMNNAEAMFVTVWLGILEISTGRLTFADAGHEKLMVRRNGTWEMLPKPHTGLPLAMFNEEEYSALPGDVRYRNVTMDLAPSDMLFQYSDGVTEAADASGNLFGEEGLREALAGETEDDPEKLLKKVRSRIGDFVKDTPQSDDITMLCVYYSGLPEQMSDLR